MKRIVWIILTFVIIIGLNSCVEQKNKRMSKEDLKTSDQRSSYTFGIDLAKKLSASDEHDYEAFLQGFRDYVEGKELLLTQEEMMKIKSEGKKVVAQKREERSNAKGNWFIAKNFPSMGST